MKKTFNLTDPKLKQARLVDAIKHEIRKYIKRERRRELPEGIDFWDFNCKFGITADEAKEAHVEAIMKLIDKAVEQQAESFYVEILAVSATRTKKPKSVESDDEAEATSV